GPVRGRAAVAAHATIVGVAGEAGLAAVRHVAVAAAEPRVAGRDGAHRRDAGAGRVLGSAWDPAPAAAGVAGAQVGLAAVGDDAVAVAEAGIASDRAGAA